LESRDVILECLKYIENNLQRPVNLDKISAYAGYSPFHFSRMFKNQTGVSVMEYVKKRKLVKASDDIMNGSRIIDAAFRYGWSSHGGFTKAFKQEYGFVPALLGGIAIEMENLGGNAMGHVFMYQTDEHATKEQLFEILKSEIEKQKISVDRKKLQQVYEFACSAYQGFTRYSGDEYVTHPLNTAIILAQMGAEENVIFSGMLCDVSEKTEISEQTVSGRLGTEVGQMVERLKKFDAGKAGLEDGNIVMIKLAERLHNMRTVEYMDEKQIAWKARETIKIFMPFARKLGNEKLTEELNDLSVRYM